MKKIICLLTLFISGNVLADSVEEMCTESDKICACAAQQLKTEVGDGDYTLYEAIGAAYIENKAKGIGAGDAWDAAVKAEANKRGSGLVKTLSKTNGIGSAHRKAIKACAG